MAKAGRKPLKLTEEMIERFIKAIRLGCPIKDACGCAGFSENWYYDQKNKAKKRPSLAVSKRFEEFSQRIKEAEGQATQRWLAVIEKAAIAGTWQAAAWKLERRRGMTAKVEQSTTIEHKVADGDATKQLMDKLARVAERDKTGGDS